MIGILDSGMGGAFSFFEYMRLCPKAPVCFYADKENQPYGEKSKEELIPLLINDMDILKSMGADTILMACCTASSVYEGLPEAYRKIAVPIIAPVAKAALKSSSNNKIGIISTAFTAKCGEFKKAIKAECESAEVFNIASPELVTLAECGECDGRLSKNGKEIIRKSLLPFENSGIDTLILGCTHFAYFEREIQNIMSVNVVNSARVGAEAVAWKH